jgi:hypothetical protein
MIDPYVPRAKHPPAYLAPFLQSLKSKIDSLVDRLAPCLPIYLGFSPPHARLVALVLSLTTGYASRQYHLKFDDFFEIVQDSKSLPQSRWQILSRFIRDTGKSNVLQPAHSQGVHLPSISKSKNPPGRAEVDSLEFEFVDPNIMENAVPLQDQELHGNNELPNRNQEEHQHPPSEQQPEPACTTSTS